VPGAGIEPARACAQGILSPNKKRERTPIESKDNLIFPKG